MIEKKEISDEKALLIGGIRHGTTETIINDIKDVSFYPKLIEGLLKRGYNKESIEKICYKNFFRVWNANLQNHQI